MTTPPFDMTAHLHRQIDWARETFGPGPRTAALLDHIRKELAEIAADPSDPREWLDVVILALEGAMRTGVSPANICATLTAMQERNEARKWADWRTAPPGVASEHDRTAECKSSKAPPGYRELVLCGSEGRGYVTAPNGDSVAVDGDWSAAWTHYDAHGRTAPPGAAIEHERTTTADAFSRHLDTASAVVATWPAWKQHVLGGFIDCPAEVARPAECKRVSVTPIYGWSRGRFPSDDLPRELAAAGVKEWDYHSMWPDSAMVYVDREADAAAVAWAVWRGLLTIQVSEGSEGAAVVDESGRRHVVFFSRIPSVEDRNKPPPGYRLALECYGFVFYDPEGRRYGGGGMRQGEALVEAWADHDLRAHGSTR